MPTDRRLIFTVPYQTNMGIYAIIQSICVSPYYHRKPNVRYENA